MAVGLLAGCGGDSPASIQLADAELLIAQGDGQFAPAGERLPVDLVISVRDTGDREPMEGVVVEWTVADGDGAELDSRVGVTDDEGLFHNGLRLGPEERPYRVRVRLVDAKTDVFVEFVAHAVAPPSLSDVPALVVAGDSAVIRGSGFSDVAEQNVVLFSGVRAEVMTAGAGTLTVRVPECLVSGPAEITVGFGSVRSGGLPTTVEADWEGVRVPVAADVRLDGTEGSACVKLAPDGGPQRYLLVVQSSARVAGARFPVGVRGRAEAPIAAPGVERSILPSALRKRPTLDTDAVDPQTRWETRIRELEAILTAGRAHGPAGGQPAAEAPPAAAPPVVGDRRRFKVLGRGTEVTEVWAQARVVGQKAAFFVDERSLEQVSDAELRGLSAAFDDPVHRIVVEAYGEESDLDDNDRVIVLLTPEVNLLTSRGEDGYVAGFFFGADLLPELSVSNQGEIFYMVVPDPTGEYSDPRLPGNVFSAIRPVLAHEFQHMVHFNQRVLVRGGEGTDALWLSEGLATMAEDLVAIERNGGAGDEFMAGNLARAVRFLSSPDQVSLTVTSGSGSLAERGAGWLFVRHLWEHFGAETVLATLTQSTLTGIDNVENATGLAWEEEFADWAVALQAEFNGSEYQMDTRRRFPRLHLSSLLDQGPVQSHIQAPRALESWPFDEFAPVMSGGTIYFEVTTPANTPVMLNVGSDLGGPLEARGRVRLTVIRLP